MDGQMKEREKLENMMNWLNENNENGVDCETITNCLLGSIASSLAIIADVMAEGRESENEPCGDS